MEYDRDKVDYAMLALLFLTSSTDRYGTRAWKGLHAETLERLHAKGWIEDPNPKGSTLTLTEAGGRKSKDLFLLLFDARE
jgi:hypothetical protein